VMTRCEEWRYF